MEHKTTPGQLFRRNYVKYEVPLADSQRARLRIAALFSRTGRDDLRERFPSIVKAELGMPYPYSYGWYHDGFWKECDITDFLSAVTLWYEQLRGDREAFLANARRIFLEEGLRYRIDDQGGVHFFVDEEFERTAQAGIAGLGEPRFAAAHHALEAALSNLGVAQQSGKGLIRGVFEAVESAFLTVIQEPKVNRLNADAIERYFKPILLQRYTGWADAEEIVSRTLAVFKAWVHVGHYYRHGTALEQIHEPPLDFAIAVATEGMGLLRQIVTK